MDLFIVLAFLFFIGSLIGWCIELLFRKFFAADNTEHKWVNPGFLNGPYLPLYGFGLCILYLLASVDVSFIKNLWLQKLALFAIMALAMTVLEYIAGLIFIKKMKVKLWDYSGEWGNIQGIICPRFSFFWAILGAVYYFLVHPYVIAALYWLASHLIFSFVIGFFFGIFSVDVFVSLQLLVKIKAFAEENKIVVRYEALKAHVHESLHSLNVKERFILTFGRGDISISEQLNKLREFDPKKIFVRYIKKDKR